MKIIFIANTTQQPLCYKRIREFIANGYNVETYCFQRDTDTMSVPEDINPHIIGKLQDNTSYIKRLPTMFQAIRKLIHQTRTHDTLYYYFQLDIAMIATSITSHPYIYEEYDLTHANIHNPIVRRILDTIDKRTIHRALLTIFTSAGFLKYHNKNTTINNAIIIPNRLDKTILQQHYTPANPDIKHLRFGYVGHIRYRSTIIFATTIADYFPQHEIHLFGTVRPDIDLTPLADKKNIFIHGPYRNPQDLSNIYSQIDILLAPEYDNYNINGAYAEPNKLYDAIYFRKPIITNPDTHTADTIKEKQIGYVIPFTQSEIVQFINSLTAQQLQQTVNSLNSIPQAEAINDNPELFKRIEQISKTLKQ